MNINFDKLREKDKKSLIDIVKDVAEKNGVVVDDLPGIAMLAWESVLKYLLNNLNGAVYLQILAVVEGKKTRDLYPVGDHPVVKIVGLCDDMDMRPQRLTRMRAGFGVNGMKHFLKVRDFKADEDHFNLAKAVSRYLNGFFELYHGPCKSKDQEISG